MSSFCPVPHTFRDQVWLAVGALGGILAAKLYLEAKARAAAVPPSRNYTQDGDVAKEIAAVTPYYPFKKIPRFYDIGGFLEHPEVFQKVVDAYVERYRGMDIDSIVSNTSSICFMVY
jgi:hypothetical protein